MLIVMQNNVTTLDLERVLAHLRDENIDGQIHRPREILISVVDVVAEGLLDEIADLPGVESVHGKAPGYWLGSRARQREDTVVEVSGRCFGGNHAPVLIAGPCAVESEDQLFRAAEVALDAGAGLLRGGAFKPRTSPYSFQGLGERGLELLARVRERFDLPVVVELRDASTLELFQQYEVDVLQIGARNMQNFEILRTAGRSGRPVLLKRGPGNSIDEWLMAAEYILLEGNPDVILCERGVTPPYGSKTRYLLDVASIPIVKSLSHLPVIADPSHAAGARAYVPALARAAMAAGAQGLLVEVHNDPAEALCDGPQALTPEMLKELVADLRQQQIFFAQPPLRKGEAAEGSTLSCLSTA
jgi:3-deoxy-7-phosphoheptulonate synthase